MWSLACWDGGFESRHGQVSLSVMFCHVQCDGPIPRPGESDRACLCPSVP